MKLLFTMFIGIFLSSSMNAQWEPLRGPYGGTVNDIVQNESNLFASTPNGLYRSDDDGRSWSRILIGLGPDYSVRAIAIRQNKLVVLASSSSSGELKSYLVKSDDNGNSWMEINKPDIVNNITIAINTYGIYIAEITHLWVSTDQGTTWHNSNLYSTIHTGRGLKQYNDQIYVCGYQTIFRSSTVADDWSEIHVEGMSSSISSFQQFDSILLVRNDYGILYNSTDAGVSWKTSFKPSYWGAQQDFIKINDVLYGYRFDDILRSVDNGLTWDSTGTQRVISKMIVVKDTIVAATAGKGILRSYDAGVSFTAFNAFLDASYVSAIEADKNYLWTGSNFSGVSRQQILTNSWDTILFPSLTFVQDIKILDGKIFVIKDRYYIYRSDDNGVTWALITPISNGTDFSELYADGHIILAGAPSGPNFQYLYKSDDYGETWQPDTFRINNIFIWPSMFAKKGNILFTADRYHIYRSVDSGLSWEILNGYMGEGWITDIKASDHLLFAMQEDDDDIPGGSTSISRDNGETWELLDLGFPMEDHTYGIQYVTEVNHNLIVTRSRPDYGIYVSTDQAVTWKHFDERLLFKEINEIISDDEYLYAATSGMGVWRRKISDLYTTSIQSPSANNELVIFPNPTNGNLSLSIDPQFSGKAQLFISDLNGKIIISRNIELELQNEIETDYMSAGVYILSLRTNEKTYTGKFIVQK